MLGLSGPFASGGLGSEAQSPATISLLGATRFFVGFASSRDVAASGADLGQCHQFEHGVIEVGGVTFWHQDHPIRD